MGLPIARLRAAGLCEALCSSQKVCLAKVGLVIWFKIFLIERFTKLTNKEMIIFSITEYSENVPSKLCHKKLLLLFMFISFMSTLRRNGGDGGARLRHEIIMSDVLLICTEPILISFSVAFFVKTRVFYLFLSKMTVIVINFSVRRFCWLHSCIHYTFPRNTGTKNSSQA